MDRGIEGEKCAGRCRGHVMNEGSDRLNERLSCPALLYEELPGLIYCNMQALCMGICRISMCTYKYIILIEESRCNLDLWKQHDCS